MGHAAPLGFHPLRTVAASSGWQPSRPRGFTLIELLVAISVMALIAILSWRGIDGMVRTQEATRQRADEMLVLQAAGQWGPIWTFWPRWHRPRPWTGTGKCCA